MLWWTCPLADTAAARNVVSHQRLANCLLAVPSYFMYMTCTISIFFIQVSSKKANKYVQKRKDMKVTERIQSWVETFAPHCKDCLAN